MNGNRADGRSTAPWGRYNVAGWTASVVRSRQGYMIDFTLPFAALGFDPSSPGAALPLCPLRMIRHDKKASRQKFATWGGADPRKRETWGVLKFE